MTHPGGRPPKFKNPEEMQEKIEEYYQDCIERKVPVTISGLSLWIGVDRKTIWNYGKRDEFFPTVKRAREFIQADMEERLQGGKGSTVGIIFSAKNNLGWTDKTEIDVRDLTVEDKLRQLSGQDETP